MKYGCALAIIDDGYLLGPPKVLADVLTEYKKNLKAIGGKLNEDKSAALLGASYLKISQCRGG